MKYILLILTIVIQFIIIVSLQLLDSFELIIGIFIACLLLGALIYFSKSEKISSLKNLGFGLFYGSLISLVSVIGFMTWLSYNFPK
ncbi:hypothetical protein NK356_09095 [Chryseobacterium sp. S0630]|uniref:hypothetical protein n=1 Tax=unclassified Chryseobacterium TaxID=2593645 RepID=UPI000558386A|nr:hypothetical protein [Chryseobacterium sp. S0630]MCP1299319.1 hypothetical protein [Chryseobacterium sp. S0630]